MLAKLASLPPDVLFTSGITVMELRSGAMRRTPDGRLWIQIQERILSRVKPLGFTYKEAVIAGDILTSLYAAGQPIGAEDVMIGAVAMSNGLTLVSGNIKHFSRIAGLKVESWIE
jgi:tRNA(fMet)-specific endonuclease VapC